MLDFSAFQDPSEIDLKSSVEHVVDLFTFRGSQREPKIRPFAHMATSSILKEASERLTSQVLRLWSILDFFRIIQKITKILI